MPEDFTALRYAFGYSGQAEVVKFAEAALSAYFAVKKGVYPIPGIYS